MKVLPMILVGLLATGTMLVAADANTPSRMGQMSYSERVERGFGQRGEVQFAGQRPEWMNRSERPDFAKIAEMRKQMIEQRGERGPMMRRGQGGPRGPMMQQRFRGDKTVQRGCPLCEMHKKMVMKKRGGNRGSRSHRK